MHVSPAKHSYAWLPLESVTTGHTDRRTDAGQSDPYLPLCFAGDTKIMVGICKMCIFHFFLCTEVYKRCIGIKQAQCKAWHYRTWGKIRPCPCDLNQVILLSSSISCEVWTPVYIHILPTRFYRQSAEFDLDLWHHDPKSIGFLFSLSTTYVWCMKVIVQKL